MSKYNAGEYDLDKAAGHFKSFLESLGFDVDNNPHMKDTPKRVAKMYCQEIFKGLYEEAPAITVFPLDDKHHEHATMVHSGRITVRSMCAHHFMPIEGVAHVGILLANNLPGLSKYTRIVRHYAQRPQTQELLGEQVVDHLVRELNPLGVGLMIKARHFCMTHRGVHERDSNMVTTHLRGVFRTHDAVRNEFLMAATSNLAD